MPLTRIRLNTRQLAGLICLAVFPNGFRGTTLPKRLDLSNKVTLIGDACATRAQTYAGESVRRAQVHAAFLAALNGFYAKVIHSDEL